MALRLPPWIDVETVKWRRFRPSGFYPPHAVLPGLILPLAHGAWRRRHLASTSPLAVAVPLPTTQFTIWHARRVVRRLEVAA